MKNKKIISNFITEHDNDPIYLAAKLSLNDKVVNTAVCDKIIKKIFDGISKDSNKIDLQLPILHELNLPYSFYKEYQSKFEDVSNELILKIIFSDLNKINKSDEPKREFDVFKLFNFRLDRDEFYESFNQKDRMTAYSFKKFINKIKDACLDIDSIPFPYSNEKLIPTSLKYIQKTNLNLLENMKVIFTYSKIQSRDIVLDAFVDQVKYIYNEDNKNLSLDYYNNVKNEILDFHPKFFKHLEENSNLFMPRKIKIDYLRHKASVLSEDKFNYFANSFKSLNTDYDLIANFVAQDIKSTDKDTKLEKNITNLISFYLKDDEEILENTNTNNPITMNIKNF